MWEVGRAITMGPTPNKVSGSLAYRRRRLLFALAAGSLAWILAVGSYGAWSWPDSHAVLQRDFDEGTKGCRLRYPERQRAERCIDLFKLMYEGERNSGVFTRIVFALLPPALVFAGFGAWTVVAKRVEAARRKRRNRPPPSEPIS